MIRSIYMEPGYLDIEALRDTGKPEIFRYEDSLFSMEYHFIRRYAGTIGEKKYYTASITARGNCGFVPGKGELTAENIRRFIAAFEQYASETGIVTEYVKFDQWNPVENHFRPYYEIFLHSRNYSIDVSNDFSIYSIPKSGRRSIKDAMKNDLEIRWGNREYLDLFTDLYANTEKKFTVLPVYRCGREYFEKCFDIYPGRCVIGTVFHDGEPVLSQFYIYSEDIFHAVFAGINPEYSHLGGAPRLDYESCYKAKEMGCRLLDLGNAPIGSTLEIFKGKLVRKRGITDCYAGKRILNREIYEALIRKNGRRDGWFPEFQMAVEE